MNKVFIRTRQIDNNKQLPILLRENDDLTDFNEYSNISKSSQILSGMDKGEESEHHLQEVLRELQYEKTVFNKAIPIPEVTEEPTYEILYKTDFKLPKHYIRLKTLDFEDELPEYDLDEEDKEWLENSKLNVTSLKFEQIIEQFEKACSQKALLLDEAKSLLRHEAVHLVIAIYDYWLTKRVNTGQTLILSVKAEKAERCNNTPIDPYIAFRKRSEKMTTRKNRRVDEASYEKMFRLRYQMEKLSEIIQLVSKREATKSQITQNERDIFVKRYDARDYDKLQLKESEITIKRQSIKLGDNFKSAQRSREENQKETKRKRSYSKSFETNQSSVEQQSEDIDFTFRPMSKCKYLPSRFTINDSNNNSNNHYFNQSHSNPKSFSLSKLSYLPEPLHKLNTPVRLRVNSNRMLSIDLQSNPTNHRLQPNLTPHSSSSSDTVESVSNRNILQKSKSSDRLISKLFSLYNRNIFCGLPPISYPSESSANNRHISLPHGRINNATNVHHLSVKPVTCFDGNSIQHHDSLHNGSNKTNEQLDCLISENDNNSSSSHHRTCNKMISKFSCNNYNNNNNNNNNNKEQIPLSISNSINYLSNHHHNGNICTYQNNSYFNSETGGGGGNKNCAFTDSDHHNQHLINGQHRKTTATKDLVESQSNHSLNGGFKKQLSKVGLNCFKSLANNKRVIPRKDINDIASFYSKSNGHQHTWLKQNTPDSCLTQTLMPLWKAEPHVMTSVNKMT